MHRIDKFLAKLEKAERARIIPVLEKINARELDSLDVKKLKGVADLYRVRLGDYRIIFKMNSGGIRLLDITKRDDTTYNF